MTDALAGTPSDGIRHHEAPSDVATTVELPPETEKITPLRVLVVDDDPLWREFLQTYLEAEGYRPVAAAGGAEALQLLEREPCAVMLLDLRMPGMSGKDLLDRLPAEGAPRVVFVTAAPTEEVSAAMSGGPHYYLPKDASPAELLLLLQALEAH